MSYPQIITDFQDVESELSLLSILSDVLIEVGQRAFASYNNATSNDPLSAAGNYAYFTAVRAKRELLCPKGWEKLDKSNLCFTINANTKIAIVVSSGSEDTGIVEGYPQTRNSKGKRTQDYIDSNCDIFGFEENVQEDIFSEFQTYMLLYYFDFEKHEIRLELSSPIAMDKGYVNKWYKRIILSPIPFDAPYNPARKIDLSSIDDLQDFDIPVKRRIQ